MSMNDNAPSAFRPNYQFSTVNSGQITQNHANDNRGVYDNEFEVTKEEVLANTAKISSGTSRSTNQVEQSFASFCWNRAFCKYLFPLFVVGAAIAGIMRAFGIKPPNRDQIPLSNFIFSRDGWEGLSAEDLPKWNTRGAGVLKLEMLNALDDHWQPYFAQSIEEWNNGDPDVVELTVTKVTADNECDFVRGKFAVCNGDYGDTSFHGVNELLVYGDSISASVAKLNEFYLASASEARKQYTMCHELGHGFGLPHSDENFFNLNLGNCMDYTDRPWTNMAPDTSTFQLLEQIYGASQPDDDTGGDEGNVVSSSSTSSGGFLRGSDEQNDEPSSIPDSIRQRAKEAATNLESKFAEKDSDEDWVQLHRDDHSASFQIELGEGFSLQAHFLLAV